MAQSQHSDIFPSSIYDDTESIQYLTSGYPQLFTPDLSSSQKTLDPLESDFLRPQPPQSIPSSFQRVGPNRRKDYVLYNNIMHSEWVDWWLETDCGKISKIRWDAAHQSECWKEFDQVADATTGQPKVMCRRCGIILEHPSSLLRPGGKTRYGTSTLMKHLQTNGCQKRAKNSNQGLDITRFLRDAVSNLQLYR